MLNPYPAIPALSALPTQEERQWGMAVHLSAFAGHFFPFGHLIAPVVIWLIKRETSAFLDDQGKEAVNAQLSVTIYGVIAAILCLVLIGIPIVIGLYIADIIFVILAGLAANQGQTYRYPWILRLVK